MKELWEWIEGFEGKYAISNLGRIKSYAIYSNGKLLNPRHDKDGYLHIGLSMGARGLSKDVRIHRMVAEAFIPNPNNYPMVNHKNGIRDDNRVENLEWCDNSYNQWHRCHIINNPPTGEYMKKKIKAININENTFKIFKSIKECSDFYGVTTTSIQRRLAGKIANPTLESKKSKLNFIKFEYYEGE